MMMGDPSPPSEALDQPSGPPEAEKLEFSFCFPPFALWTRKLRLQESQWNRPSRVTMK